MKKFLINCLFLGCIAFAISCGSSSGTGGGCDEERFTELISAYVEAGTVYIQDTTKVNCEAYIEAIQEYLDAIDDCDNIFEADLEEAREAAAEIDCG